MKWACGWRPHPGKIYIAAKARENNSGGCKQGRLKHEKDYDLRMKVGSWNVRTMLQADKTAEIAEVEEDLKKMKVRNWKKEV